MKSAFIQVLLLFFGLSLLSGTGLRAQDWDWLQAAGLEENESGRAVIAGSGGDLYWAGTFEGESQVGDTPLSSAGGDDLFLARFSATGNPVWATSIGSGFDDAMAGLAVDPAGNLYAGGTYWLEMQIGEVLLTTDRNPKSIFLARYNSDGEVLWARSIDGSGSKDLNDLQVGNDGSLLLAGFFSDSLFFGDTVLTAAGHTDLFVAKLTPDGQLTWAGNWGYSGDARATCLTTDGSGGAVIGGFYNDTLIIGNTLIRSISLDLDVFLLRVDEQGQPLWLRKAGGVQDQEITGLALSPDGKIFGTGFLVGVMTLGNGLVIQSQSGNPDPYIFRYHPDGTAEAARVFGSNQVQQSMAIAANGSNVVIAGFYQGELAIDGQAAPAGSGFSAFTAGFNEDLTLRWLASAAGTQTILNAALTVGPNGGVYTTGTFAGAANFDGLALVASGKNDAFLARLRPELTSASTLSQPENEVQIFPNPVRDHLQIACGLPSYEISLYDSYGRLLATYSNPVQLNLTAYPPGWYALHLSTPEGFVISKKVLKVP